MHDRLSPELATTHWHPEVHIQSFFEEGNKELESDVEEEAKILAERFTHLNVAMHCCQEPTQTRPLTRASTRACTLSARVACCIGPSISRPKPAILIEQFVLNAIQHARREEPRWSWTFGASDSISSVQCVTYARRMGHTVAWTALAVDFAVCLQGTARVQHHPSAYRSRVWMAHPPKQSRSW